MSDMEEQSVSIRISLEAYQELVLRKISTGVPITTQIDRLLINTLIQEVKNGTKSKTARTRTTNKTKDVNKR
jgi:hypothetical protein